MTRHRLAVAGLLVALTVAGCGREKPVTELPPDPPKAVAPAGDEVAAERAKLDPTDRTLVEAQEWCVISTEERLGAMGPPLKLDIKGQPVFVCCKGCRKKAEADPDKTLAKVTELKAKAAAERSGKK